MISVRRARPGILLLKSLYKKDGLNSMLLSRLSHSFVWFEFQMRTDQTEFLHQSTTSFEIIHDTDLDET